MYSETVTRFIAQGAKQYSQKEYEQAATSYADACAAFNDEHSRDDPDLLLLYGKALFQNGVAKSGVLGGVSGVNTGNGESADTEDKNSDGEDEDESGFQFHEGMAEEDNDNDNNNDTQSHVALAEGEEEKEGQENAPSDGEEEGEPEEEQTDFEVAWDILDHTRALFEELAEGLEKESAGIEPPYLASDDDEPKTKYAETIKKLSETYDLLGEVSLETENFPQAASDLQSCLELRQKLYNTATSSWISESHYKLSLALEFCVEDSESRSKAADHVKSAIEIVKAQVEAQPELDETKKSDKVDMLRDLEERYKELQKDPEQEVQAEQLDIIKGILGEAVGGPSAARALIEETQKKPQVNDLSSMVKKRKAKPDASSAKKPKTD